MAWLSISFFHRFSPFNSKIWKSQVRWNIVVNCQIWYYRWGPALAFTCPIEYRGDVGRRMGVFTSQVWTTDETSRWSENVCAWLQNVTNVVPDCKMTANVLQNAYHSLILECFFLLLGAVIMLGRNNMFRFNHPAEAQKLKQMRKVGETVPDLHS